MGNHKTSESKILNTPSKFLQRLYQQQTKLYIKEVQVLTLYTKNINDMQQDLEGGMYIMHAYIPMLYAELYRNER